MAERDLERQLIQAKADFAEGLGAVTILIEQNAAETARVEGRVNRHAGQLGDFFERLVKLEAQMPSNLRERLAKTELRGEDIREETGKIRTLEIENAKDTGGVERTKARWGATATIIAATVAAVSALILQLVQMLSSAQ